MPRSAFVRRVTPIRRRKLDERANMLRLCLIRPLRYKLNRGRVRRLASPAEDGDVKLLLQRTCLASARSLSLKKIRHFEGEDTWVQAARG